MLGVLWGPLTQMWTPWVAEANCCLFQVWCADYWWRVWAATWQNPSWWRWKCQISPIHSHVWFIVCRFDIFNLSYVNQSLFTKEALQEPVWASSGHFKGALVNHSVGILWLLRFWEKAKRNVIHIHWELNWCLNLEHGEVFLRGRLKSTFA